MMSIPFMMALTLSGVAMAQPATRPAEIPGDLRVMTFNIRYGTANDGENRWERRREILFDVIRRHRPDVLGLQEALRFQIDEIKTAMPGYDEIGAGRDDGRQKGEYAAILYREERLRPTESGTFWLSDTPETPGSKSWGNTLPRICTWARFEDSQTRGMLYVYNAHLDHQSQPSRDRSVRLMARRIAERAMPETPVIVTGDFNAGEGNPAVRYLAGEPTSQPASGDRVRLVDTFRALHPEAKEAGTFHEFRGTTDGEKIDYLLTTPGVNVLESEILHDNSSGRYPSDHFPVFARLRLR